MIVQSRGAMQLLITQPDHAALAARIMRAWRADGFQQSGRRADILIAIEEHDSGWHDADAAPTLDPATFRVRDFMTASDDIRRGVWPVSVRRLAGSPYAAALVAYHAVHVYRRYRGEKGWDGFFAEMEAARDHHLSASGHRNQDELRRDYVFLRIADLASLAFCCGWTETQTDDSGSGYAARVDGSRLIITPDPFEGRDLPIAVTARELPSALKTQEELSAAFAKDPITLNGVVSGR
ncbi:MAG TPA: DUF3891 family protein [Gemmatimonadales bacterium]|jgi:hypothetical protein